VAHHAAQFIPRERLATSGRFGKELRPPSRRPCLGGLSSAEGSVALAMVADMWEADTQQCAVAYVIFSLVGGLVLGPIVGGLVEAYLSWRWCIWIQLIFGGALLCTIS
jgi:MFS family permease